MIKKEIILKGMTCGLRWENITDKERKLYSRE